MHYKDVVIHTNENTFGSRQEMLSLPAINNRQDLSGQIWAGRLDFDLARLVMDTCEPKIVGTTRIERQYSQLYSFVRELSHDAGDPYRWDHDNELASVIALSRLIHPTSIGFTYAARLGYGNSGGVKTISSEPVPASSS